MDSILLTVINMSVTASFVIVGVCIARLLLKMAPKTISYALWVIVAFRLVIPFSFESMFSLMPINSNPIPNDIIYYTSPGIDTGLENFDNTVNAALPTPTQNTVNSVNPLRVLLNVGEIVWVVGMGGMVIYSIVTMCLLKYRLKNAIYTKDNIYEVDNLKTPFVLGYLSPKIYIPASMKPEEMGYIILHEKTHIKRKDHIIKLFAFLVLCVHWFNPLVWVAFVLMSADMELSCDERVLKELGDGIKKDYSTSLLSFSTGRRIINGSPLAFGEGGVKNRIKNVLNFKKPTRVIIIVAIMIAIAAAVGFMTNKTRIATPPNENSLSILVSDIEKVKKGMTVEEVHSVLGEPHGMLSGFWGDVYNVDDGSQLTIYYDNDSKKVQEILLNTSNSFIGNSTNKIMSINDLRMLAKKGDALGIEDFADYLGINLSSNSYSYLGLVRLDAPYRLIIRADSEGKLVSTTLEGVWEDSGTGIDIRYGDLESFIEDRPIHMTLKEGTLSKTGATVVLTNLTNKDYRCGEYFLIQHREDSDWKDLDTVIKEYGFDDLAYVLQGNGNIEITINWGWLYGTLPQGDYRLCKLALHGRSYDEHDAYQYCVAFSIPE